METDLSGEPVMELVMNSLVRAGEEVLYSFNELPGHVCMANYGFASPEMGWNLAQRMRQLISSVVNASELLHGTRYAA